jgi:hypothetical protein
MGSETTQVLSILAMAMYLFGGCWRMEGWGAKFEPE